MLMSTAKQIHCFARGPLILHTLYMCGCSAQEPPIRLAQRIHDHMHFCWLVPSYSSYTIHAGL